MSWNFSAVGAKEGVLKYLQEERQKQKCSYPEEEIRQAAYDLMEKSVKCYPDDGMALNISAYGHQNVVDKDGKAANNVFIKIEYIYNFKK